MLFKSRGTRADSLYAIESLLPRNSAMAFYRMPFRISEFATGAVMVFFYQRSCSSLCRHLGKVSYSLYLVHWPVIVLVSYWKLGGIGAKSLVVVIPVIYLLALALHHQVEQRFRLLKTETDYLKKGYGITLFAVIKLLFGASVLFGKGWSWRYSSDAQVVVNAMRDLSTNNDEKRRLLNDYQAAFQHQKSIAQHYIISDSFAEDTMLALKFSMPELNLKLLSIRAACQSVLAGEYDETKVARRACNNERDKAYRNPQLKDAVTIYLAASWREPGFSNLAEAIEFLHENTSAKVIVFGPRADFHDVPTLAMRYGKEAGLNEFLDQYKSPSIQKNTDRLRMVAEQASAKFIDVYRIM